jgi:hypothetical protein
MIAKFSSRNGLGINGLRFIKNVNNGKIYGADDKERFLIENEFIRNKNIISISPGGYKGIYVLGVCNYIKDNFNLDKYVFSGASAGAWNSLMLAYKHDTTKIKRDVLDYSLRNTNSILQIENTIKERLLMYTKIEDYDIQKVFIGTTTFSGFGSNTTIFYDFNNLEDAINCCIASSHIPLITGGFTNKYKNTYTFDGGFSKYPYLDIYKPAIHITPSMWKIKRKKPSIITDIHEHTTLFSKHKFDFIELYQSGYEDAHKNREYLRYYLGDPEDL